MLYGIDFDRNVVNDFPCLPSWIMDTYVNSKSFPHLFAVLMHCIFAAIHLTCISVCEGSMYFMDFILTGIL